MALIIENGQDAKEDCAVCSESVLEALAPCVSAHHNRLYLPASGDFFAGTGMTSGEPFMRMCGLQQRFFCRVHS